MIALALLWSAAALAIEDDVNLILEAPDRFLVEGHRLQGLPVAHGFGGIGNYPVGTWHKWHGFAAGDIAMAANDRAAYRMGLTTQTVADYENSISFRLTRVYYQATAAFDHRLGPGILTIGYRHWCTHGTDDAVKGRILFRSGPEVGWAAQTALAEQWRLLGTTGVHLTLVGQNIDPDFKPRAQHTLAGTLEYGLGQAGGFAAAGLGTVLVGDVGGLDFTLGTPIGHAEVVVLPAFSAGLVVRGAGVTGRFRVHYQHLMDTGFTPRTHPEDLVALEPRFDW